MMNSQKYKSNLDTSQPRKCNGFSLTGRNHEFLPFGRILYGDYIIHGPNWDILRVKGML